MTKLSLTPLSLCPPALVLGCVWAVVGGGVATSRAQILNIELASPFPPPVVALPLPALPQPLQLLFANPTTFMQLTGAAAIGSNPISESTSATLGSAQRFQAAVMSKSAIQMAGSGTTSVLSTDSGLTVSSSPSMVQVPPSFTLPDPVQELVERSGTVFPPLAE